MTPVNAVLAQIGDQVVIVSGVRLDERATWVEAIVEKPEPDMAPSTRALVGGEIQLTDGIAKLLQQRAVYGYQYSGIRYDCGSKEGFFKATYELGRKYHGF